MKWRPSGNETLNSVLYGPLGTLGLVMIACGVQPEVAPAKDSKVSAISDAKASEAAEPVSGPGVEGGSPTESGTVPPDLPPSAAESTGSEVDAAIADLGVEAKPGLADGVSPPTQEQPVKKPEATAKEVADDAAAKVGADKDRKQLSDQEMLELLDEDDLDQAEFEKAFGGKKKEGVKLPGAPE